MKVKNNRGMAAKFQVQTLDSEAEDKVKIWDRFCTVFERKAREGKKS